MHRCPGCQLVFYCWECSIGDLVCTYGRAAFNCPRCLNRERPAIYNSCRDCGSRFFSRVSLRMDNTVNPIDETYCKDHRGHRRPDGKRCGCNNCGRRAH